MNGVDFRRLMSVRRLSPAFITAMARKRIVKIYFDGPAPAQGTQITAGETNIGQVGSTAGVEGLAMVRLDRLEEARAAGVALKAGDVTVEVTLPG
jgi:folate-binding Fe-S cluster repair protein YgfZ